jgi:hypothetical protein
MTCHPLALFARSSNFPESAGVLSRADHRFGPDHHRARRLVLMQVKNCNRWTCYGSDGAWRRPEYRNTVPAMIASAAKDTIWQARPRANFARRASQITDFRWANLGASTVRRKSLHLQRRTRPDFKNQILKQREHRTPDNLPTVGVSCLWRPRCY